MRKPLLFMITVLLVLSCKNEQPERTLPPNTYEVNVTAKGVYNGIRSHLIILNDRRQEIQLDTAMIANETATFTGKVESPAMRLLTINGIRGHVQFVLEPGITNIEVYKDSISKSVVDGGKNNDDHNAYKALYKQRADELKALGQEIQIARQLNDSVKYGNLMAKNIERTKAIQDLAYEYIADNPDSDFSLLLLETMLIGSNPNVEKIKSSIAILNDVVNRSNGNKFLGRKIRTFVAQKEALANLEIGKIAPNFSAPDPNGKEIALNDIKGKATIIDFWASWCGPCRRENPNVVRVYEKYHDKGLEIISVSLDKPNQKDRWLQAIEKDKLTWHHVSNLKYFNEPVARLYNVSAIPATFILDEDGKIVAKKLRGKALEDQIASMLN
ncbi:MAG: AhpC/TSA family protein [Bacteroidia bacterium]|nr:AhpC/TSA family protein [Bacteroidia bacterium]NND52784.1 AhpC/TSA family protein [Flavobacteriaceae bacterium]